ncbi:phage head morphogenesis protein [Arsenophonus endosymbiont of Bemisia tabaci Asia II 3]|nr:phage head morphogenesis protein [Arsenophonus endosymbiont of Bemisia tabaci Asia II 3]
MAVCFGLPPARAITYLRAKGYRITWDWEEMWQEAHAQAFTVAKVMRLDILEDIRQAQNNALAEGKTLPWFKKELTLILQAKGWWGKIDITDPVTGEPVTVQQGSVWRLETIDRTNISLLYSAGRWAEQQVNIDDRPYWMYVAIRDNRTRKSHLALHGLVFPADDPFRQTFYPPNGWRCLCSVIALTADDIRQRGLAVDTAAGRLATALRLVSEKTGEMKPVTTFHLPSGKTLSLDIGFSYTPGRAYASDLARYGGPLAALACQQWRGPT